MVATLEIRINSIADAKAVVSNLEVINRKIKSTGANSVELKIAQECAKAAKEIIAGVFRVKTYYSFIKCDQGRILFTPEPYCEECAKEKAFSV